MLIKTAEYIISSPGLKSCPPPLSPEYAFMGRSNVGKSSLINMITNHKSLAKTSGRPGKTRMINYFHINTEWYIVDLPGYGYAGVSKKDRARWYRMVKEYLKGRKSLLTSFILIDSRIPPQTSDLNYINWFGENQLPFVILFTKVDKLKDSELKRNIASFCEELGKNWSELPRMINTSAVTKTGRDEILTYVSETNTYFKRELFEGNK